MCSPPMTSSRGDDVPPPTKETPWELREHGDPASGSGVGLILCHDTFIEALSSARYDLQLLLCCVVLAFACSLHFLRLVNAIAPSNADGLSSF